jgi:hypothetical protein
MKKIIIRLTALWCLGSCSSNPAVTIDPLLSNATTITPLSLLTSGGKSWQAPATGPAGKLIKVKFEADGSFAFSYTGKNAQQDTITVQGRAIFAVNSHGKNIFTLRPSKGSRWVNNKEMALDTHELKEKFSIEYRWEMINFKDIPSEDFLLLVDVGEHPGAAFTKAGNIDRAWVSKFYPNK